MEAVTDPATCTSELWGGLPAHRLRLPGGDAVWVAEHGAQVLSWQTQGSAEGALCERLFLSSRSAQDGRSAIRGGIPLCWPQFNARGPLPKHGFARNMPWRVGAVVCQADQAELSLHLESSDATRALWPVDFQATLTVRLQPGALRTTLRLNNPSAQPWTFTGALHTYLAVDDVARTSLAGLAGQAEWDAVADSHATAAERLVFAGEFDRVYVAPSQAMHIQSPGASLAVEQSSNWGEVVVWNPGPIQGAVLADMPPDGYRHMLCVEAAQVFTPIEVAAGAMWEGWQQLRVA